MARAALFGVAGETVKHGPRAKHPGLLTVMTCSIRSGSAACFLLRFGEHLRACSCDETPPSKRLSRSLNPLC